MTLCAFGGARENAHLCLWVFGADGGPYPKGRDCERKLTSPEDPFLAVHAYAGNAAV